MASKIHILDEQTANQIAAGEVVENPASVVKELVENAIDAQADEISIEILGSGHQLIRIQDNGCGMTKEDALLCLERHATSKLHQFSDLFSVHTMGFRGEAIPSIASISEFTLLTTYNTGKSSELLPATLIQVSGGKMLSCEETKALPGTCVEVRSLFFNTPARKKFQKTPARDAHDIIKIVRLLAMSHPHIAFQLKVHGKVELCVEKTEDQKQRVQDILGQQMMDAMVPCSRKPSDDMAMLSIEGFVHQEGVGFLNRNHQYLFVNRRAVSSLIVSYAVKHAFGPLLEQNRHPGFVLFLNFCGEEVDVNVHPQKREVRFRDEDHIKKVIQHAISQALFPEFPRSNDVDNYHVYPNMVTTSALNTPSVYAKSMSAPHEEQICIQQSLLSEPVSFFQLIGSYKEYLLLQIQWDQELAMQLPEDLSGDGIIFMHIQRALAQIAYEDLQRKEGREKSVIESQQLLLPVFLELPLTEAQFFEMMLPSLQNMGFSVREFGARSFLVEAVPVALSYLHVDEIRECILEIIHQADLNGFSLTGVSVPKLIEQETKKIADMMSKKWRLPIPLAEETSRKIVRRLLCCKQPFYCPFGRSIFMKIRDEDIQKNFTRNA